MTRTLCILMCLLLAHMAFGQGKKDGEKNLIIEQRVELIAEQLEAEEIDFTTLFDELSYYYDHPLNLNRASKEELMQLTLLTEFQVNSLLLHMQNHGKLITIYELQSIDGFDVASINLILPFVKVSTDLDAPHISLREILKNSNNEIFIRYIRVIEEMEGFSPINDSLLVENPNRRYLGSPDRYYLRYRFKFTNRISVGFTAEKDAGEDFFKGTQNQGFDYYSAHFYLRNFGAIRQLAIGDYQVQIGQGLTFWSGLAFSKSSYVMGIKKNALTIRPYTSVDENLFMRGAATTVALKNFEITGFYSSKFIDANISSDDTLNKEELVITSFQSTGYHRTPGEIFDKDAISETIYGGHVAYKTRSLHIGATAVQSAWGANLQRNLSLYNQFEFNSSNNLNLGVDYNFLYHNINFFGEVARSENGGLACLNGAMIGLDPRLALSVLHRNYEKEYQSLYSDAFAEGSKNTNEQGIYLGLVAKPFKHITFAGYFDKYTFPWLRYQADAPSKGFDYLLQLSYKPSKKLEAYLRYRKEVKSRNTKKDIDEIDYIVDQDKESARLNIACKLSDALRLRNRVEVSKYYLEEQEPEYGYMVCQDVLYKPKMSRFSFTFRFALFDTDSYDSRIYAYENDVLYYYSIPSYYYRGSRTYLTLRYQIVREIDVWLRLAQTVYSDRNVISSGLNEITGNTKTEVKAQARFKF